MSDFINPEDGYAVLELGQKVEFEYHGSQPQAGQRVTGEVVGFTPVIQWEGGSVPFSEAGYAIDVRVIE